MIKKSTFYKKFNPNQAEPRATEGNIHLISITAVFTIHLIGIPAVFTIHLLIKASPPNLSQHSAQPGIKSKVFLQRVFRAKIPIWSHIYMVPPGFYLRVR